MTEETISVRKKYLEAGIAAKYLHSIPDDHISTELEFLVLLAQEVVTLCEKGKRSDATQKYEAMNDFFSNHLALWAPTFAENIVENTNEDFFKGAALALRGLVDGYK
jgi:TorA maturation chaperone TorD